MSINSSQVAGKRKIVTSVEQTNVNEQKRRKMKEEETSDDVFGATGPGGLALGNPIILEKIVGFLNAGDFCRWYDSSQIFKDKFDKMDDIFWKRQAQTLAAVLNKMKEDSLEEQWPGKTDRDIFFILKSKVKRLVVKIKAILDSLPFSFLSLPSDVTYIEDAARLAHHGFLGSLRRFSLKRLSLTSIPIKHMASLVACVNDEVQIDDVTNQLSVVVAILDNVQCESLSLLWLGDLGLTTVGTQALVRAMRTRVRKVCVRVPGGGHHELMKYNGKGKCEQVNFLNIWQQGRHDIMHWVKDCKWEVVADEDNFLLVKRKES